MRSLTFRKHKECKATINLDGFLKGFVRILLLAFCVVLTVGTSKRLVGKELQSPKDVPLEGVELLQDTKGHGTASVWLSEDVNNQGCFATQWINFSFHVPLRNASDRPLYCKPKDVDLRIDGQREKIDKARFRLLDVDDVVYKNVLPPGKKGILYIDALAVLRKKKLKKVDKVTLSVTTNRGVWKLNFTGIRRIRVKPTH
jgi:hypothetical protein